MSVEYLAHSGMNGRPPQSYYSHITGVVALSQYILNEMLSFIPGYKHAAFRDILTNAATFHDLGKLDEENQIVLHGRVKKNLPHEHRDAGAKYLRERRGKQEAATLVYAHHGPGLPNLIDERAKAFPFRFDEVVGRTDSHLDSYLRIHEEVIGKETGFTNINDKGINSMDYRMLLSCLVDADYSDTSGIYPDVYPTLWEERINRLDSYIAELNEKYEFDSDQESMRNVLRQKMYECCKITRPVGNVVYCDSPVGTGKTTAVMAHLLQVAKERHLRHIIVVLPYTNIISQAVKIYRKALVLDGEDPSRVVAEHHHQADYESKELCRYSSTWAAPITVTTAVQFFESLASNYPSKLRKINQLPGSAIFIDESHAALPMELMLPAWNWISCLSEEWGCYFCLCSGTTLKFWNSPCFNRNQSQSIKVEPLLKEDLARELNEFEVKRVNIDALASIPPHFSDIDRLISNILSIEGPRLIVMNTVKSAAYIANQMKQEKDDVLHLSTALTPEDREIVIGAINNRLNASVGKRYNPNWTLVATSCVECGLDFSFRNGFCELRSLSSYLQLSGRINRNNEYGNSKMYYFTQSSPFLSHNPSFNRSISVFQKQIDFGNLHKTPITKAVTQSFDMECKESVHVSDSICRDEKKGAFANVAQNFRVIDEDTETVVANEAIIDKLERGETITPTELIRGSVNINRGTIKKLNLQTVAGLPEIYKLSSHQYNSFLGYSVCLLNKPGS